MRTIRILIVAFILALILIPAVFLRPAWPASPDQTCRNNSDFLKTVAKERDRGLKLIEAIRRVHNMLMQGHLGLEQYPLTIAIIHDVYNNPKESPDALAKAHEQACLKAYGIVAI